MRSDRLTSPSATVTELHLSDAEFPQTVAERPTVRMQTSAPIVVDLRLDGRYQQYTVRPGDFCIAPPGLITASRWRGSRSILALELAPWLLASVAETHRIPAAELQARIAVEDPQVSHLMFALRAEYINGGPSGAAYVDAISRAIALRLLTAHTGQGTPRTLRGGLSRQALRRVLEFVDVHLDEDLGLDSLAAVSGLSTDHFARAFRESTGEPPHRYLVHRRLERALRLLEVSDRPIAEIAHALGFTDQSHLTKLFRRHFGVTPGRVRAEAEGSRESSGILQ